MTPAGRQEALAYLSEFVERARRMQGWTFDEVKKEQVGPGPAWNYGARARKLTLGARSVLDIGTGGGEAFSAICEGYEGFGLATEAWPPNVQVAAKRLSPMGIRVVHASGSNLPFSMGSLDVVLNRHEDLDPADVARVLAPGGRVLTQQVGPQWQEIVPFFPMTSPEGSDDLFQTYTAGFEGAGLTVAVAESHGTPVAYRSLGDLVYMMTVVMPQGEQGHEFDLETDLDALLALERELSGEKGIVLTETRFLIEAVKGS